MVESKRRLVGLFPGKGRRGARLRFPKRNAVYEFGDLVILPDVRAVAEVAAETVAAAADGAVAEHGGFTLAVSGGGAFDSLWEVLSSPALGGRIPWDRTLVAFTDEPCTREIGAAPNHGAFRKRLGARVPLDDANVLRMPVEQSNPTRAALFYEQTLRERLPGRELPAFDLTVLAVGPEGGTAGLFPGAQAPDGAAAWVVAVYVPDRGAWWLTLTPGALSSSRRVVFLVSEAGAAPALACAFGGAPRDGTAPWQTVAAMDGSRLVLADKAAAALLR